MIGCRRPRSCSADRSSIGLPRIADFQHFGVIVMPASLTVGEGTLMLIIVKRARVAVLLAIFGVAWVPLQAFAQVPIPCIPGLTCPSPDNTPPTVSITSPASGSTVSGTINVTASASDNVGVAGVQFMLDGGNLGAEDTSAPYSVSWNTTTASSGSHTLTARARDAAGNATTSTAVAVTVSDTTPPAVSLTSPASGSTVSGTMSVTATASDNAGVAGVQ